MVFFILLQLVFTFALKGENDILLNNHEELTPIEMEVHVNNSTMEYSTNANHEFENWMKKYMKHFKMSNVYNERGVAYTATHDIKKGEPLFSIPIETLMTTTSAQSGRIQSILNANPHFSDEIILALHVLEEKFKYTDSKWYYLINHFPKSFEKLPHYYNQEELNIISNSQIARISTFRNTLIDTFYDALQKVLSSEIIDPPIFKENEFTLLNWKWALSVVWSCSIDVPTGSNRIEKMLIPMMDSMDYCSNCTNVFEMDSSNKYAILKAPIDFNNGDYIKVQLTSTMSNFFANHGYLPTNEPLQKVLPMQISIGIDDPIYELKNLILQQHDMNINTSVILQLDHPISALEMFLLRIKLLIPSEIDLYKNAYQGEYISIRNEYATLRAMLQSCNQVLNAYSTTIEEDEFRLQKDHLPKYVQTALQIAIQDRIILEQTKASILSTWNSLLE